MAGVFSISAMLQTGQLPGSLCATPSWLHPQGGQTYCFFSCAHALREKVANVPRASEPTTTNSLRFIYECPFARNSSENLCGRGSICSETPLDGVNGPKPVTKRDWFEQGKKF